ncbi:hypothetical protein VNO77_31630 [Canavalia gladiata]|uniref:Uncharacterized protein n=1 Tax=Canavalia gladiata TaxID=3824 RepID=A0AAN9KSL2_CANGL
MLCLYEVKIQHALVLQNWDHANASSRMGSRDKPTKLKPWSCDWCQQLHDMPTFVWTIEICCESIGHSKGHGRRENRQVDECIKELKRTTLPENSSVPNKDLFQPRMNEEVPFFSPLFSSLLLARVLDDQFPPPPFFPLSLFQKCSCAPQK